MAIIEALWQPNEGSSSVGRSDPTVTHVWCVLSDTLADSAYTIATKSRGVGKLPDHSLPVPQLYEQLNLGNDASIYLGALDFSPAYEGERQGTHVWKLSVSYGNPYENADDEGNPDPAELLLPPCDRSPVWSIETGGTYSRELEVDLDGKAVVNSCGQQFDPQVMVDDWLPMLVADTRVCDWALLVQTVLGFHNTINSEPYLGEPARTWRLQVVAGKLQWENEYAFWPVSFRFEYNALGWDFLVLDRGYEFLDDDGHMHRVRDVIDELAETGPWLLDGACNLLNPPPGIWTQGQAYNVCDVIQHGDNWYIAQNSGTAGPVPPTHETGTVTDGGIYWTWIGKKNAAPVNRKGVWQANTAYNTGDVTTSAGGQYLAQDTGISGTTAPTHDSGTVSDGSLDWTACKPSAVNRGPFRGYRLADFNLLDL